MDLPDRIQSKISPEPNSGCWLWTAFTNRAGYGMVYSLERTAQNRLAHRVVYEAIKGPIPDRMTLDHLCNMPACVNPDHLEPVTRSENTKRARRNKGT